MGAALVVDHSKDLKEQLSAQGVPAVDYVLNTTDPNTNFDALGALLAPLGKMCCILPVTKPVNLAALFQRRASVVFELMFMRPLFDAVPETQGAILDHVARLVDVGTLRSTLVTKMPWTLGGLVEAHQLMESGKAIGKAVMTLE
jgi:NADPH:quinone reductase-like Zn-dependent oxidoreductase